MRPRHGKGSNEFGIQSVEAGIDYLTMQPHGVEAQKHAIAVIEQLQEEEERAGEKRVRQTFQGWRGWRTASAFLGSSRTGWILSVSGAAADGTATRLRSYAGRVSRLDVQSTVCLSQPQPRFAESSLRLSTRRPSSRQSSSPLTGLMKASDGACIGTAGRRINARYRRVYDKGVEDRTHAPGLRWRYEVECKRDLGDALWRDFQGATDVRSWCYDSCEAQWKCSGLSWLLPSSETLREAVRAPSRGPATGEVLDRWYRSTVAPTAKRYVALYGVAKLLEALGISDLAMPRSDGDA